MAGSMVLKSGIDLLSAVVLVALGVLYFVAKSVISRWLDRRAAEKLSQTAGTGEAPVALGDMHAHGNMIVDIPNLAGQVHPHRDDRHQG